MSATGRPGSPESPSGVRVLLFSALRDAVGQREITLAVPEPPTGHSLLDSLQRAHPAIERFRPVLRLAVNSAYVSPQVRLQPGDEVALITPVSGG